MMRALLRRIIEFFLWFIDFGRWIGLLFQRKIQPALGGGTDYTASHYKHKVRRLVETFHPSLMSLKVVEIIQETPSTKTFRFERTDGPLPDFRGGQYVNLFLEASGVRTSRPYSISSPPGADLLDLTVRLKPEGFVAPYLMSQVEVGEAFESTGPTGHFYIEPLVDDQHLVFLAGGSGITPFMSMIRQQARDGWDYDIHLLYGCRTPNDVIFGEELARLAAQTERFRYALVISEPPPGYTGRTGLLDGKLIASQIDEVTGRTFFTCGPNLMYDLCLAELQKLDVPIHKIRHELYGPPEDVTRLPGWPEGLRGSTHFDIEVEGHPPFQARADEPLLVSFERHHIVVPAVCRSGECSACRTRVLQGKVFMPPETGVREADLTYGYVHACVAYPLENLKIRL